MDRLVPLVYEELRALAKRELYREARLEKAGLRASLVAADVRSA